MSSPHPLFEPMEWELFDEGVHVAFAMAALPLLYDRVAVFGANHNGRAAAPWLVLLPDDATGVAVPPPPSTATLEEVFGAAELAYGYVAIWQEDPTGEFEAKWARSTGLWMER